MSIDPQGNTEKTKKYSLDAGKAQSQPPVRAGGGQLGCAGFSGQGIYEAGLGKGELSGRENDGQWKLKVRWSRQCQQHRESLGR